MLCTPSVNTGIFSAMKEEDNIKGDFCGHDHNNDFSGYYDDIFMAYGRKSGYGSYGPENMTIGARVIKLSEK